MFILDCRNDVRQKENLSHFLLKFKMGHKAVETTCNINSALGPGTATKCTVRWWFRKFCKGDERLEDEELSGPSSEADDDQLRAIIQTDPLTTAREVAKELNTDHSKVTWHLKQIGKVKNLISECLICWLKIKHFEVSPSLMVCNNKAPFLDWIVMCDEKWILYDNQWQPAQCFDWKEAPKHFPKPNLHQKKVMVTVWWSAACLIHYNFLNPSETITSEKYAQQIDEMYWNLQWLYPALVNRKGPALLHDNSVPHVTQTMLQKFQKKKKLNELGYEVLLHPPYSPDLSPTDDHFFKHLDNFLQGKHFHN